MNFVLNQLSLAFFNLVNSRIDAYRILRHKTIAHGINFGAYAVFTTLVIWVADYNLKRAIWFGASAFINRQLSFDIPLNLRRGLPWYYQSSANPPKAIWDRIERWFFGIDYDGKKIVMWYSIFYVFTLIPEIV
jgi:hypothetical protein